MNRNSRTTKGILAVAALIVIASALAAATPRRNSPRTITGDTLAAPPAHDQPIRTFPPAPAPKPEVEVVFALDTTGSMGGLIEGAKQKIWSIANHIASGQPTPDLRVGLVAYRDRGDAYVTRVYDLSSDLDSVFEHLQSFQAAGGGDGPEHVNRALYDAVHHMKWSQDAMKMVFLVGDAPPHMDYDDGYDYHKITREAAQMGIVMHAIRCGNDADTGRVWAEIAHSGQGTFATIDQSGGVLAVATPMDRRLGELSRRLFETAIVYGDDADRLRVAHMAAPAESAPAPVAADRSAYFGKTAGGGGKLDRADIVGGIVGSTKAMEPDKLPAEMRSMSDGERKAFIEKKRAERAAVAKEISELSARRDAFVKDELKKTKHADGFDAVVDKAIEHQAVHYGIKY